MQKIKKIFLGFFNVQKKILKSINIKEMKKYAKYQNMQRGVWIVARGVESRTNRPKARQAQDFIPVLQPLPNARVFASNLYLALACIKSKTHNKNI